MHLSTGIVSGLDDPCRVANGGGSSGDGFGHHSVAAYASTSSDLKPSQDLGPSTHHHICPEGRVSFGAFVQTRAPQSHPLVDGATIPDFCSLSNDHPHGVIKKNASPDFCGRMNFNAR